MVFSLGSGWRHTGGDSRAGSSCPLAASLRYDSNSGGEREIQRTMLELLNQLDGFDSRGDVKVIMATNRIETLDPALIRPGQAAWAPSWSVNALTWFCISKGHFGEDGLTGYVQRQILP